jgi:hypothetical protein
MSASASFDRGLIVHGNSLGWLFPYGLSRKGHVNINGSYTIRQHEETEDKKKEITKDT